MWTQLWNDEAGFVITTELLLVAVVLVIGIVAGISALRTAMLGELSELGTSISNIDNSFFVGGSTEFVNGQVGASTPGFGFTDPTNNNNSSVVTTNNGQIGSVNGIAAASAEFPGTTTTQLASE